MERELHEIVKKGISVAMDEPTDCVHSLVLREKPNGSLRVCLDPNDLNKAIKREHFPVTPVDMVTNILQDATFFSHLDGNSAYWNVELNDQSS